MRTVTFLLSMTSHSHRYWPNQGDAPLVFAGITVANGGSKAYVGYNLSVLKVSCGGESRSLCHYYYTAWPDHGIPRTAAGNIYTDDIIGKCHVKM